MPSAEASGPEIDCENLIPEVRGPDHMTIPVNRRPGPKSRCTVDPVGTAIPQGTRTWHPVRDTSIRVTRCGLAGMRAIAETSDAMRSDRRRSRRPLS